MRKLMVLFAVLTLAFSTANAQLYKQALGVRLGYTQALEYKVFTNPSQFLNIGVLLHTVKHFGISGYAFYNFNHSVSGDSYVSWYYGPGVVLGYNGYMAGFNATVNAQIGIEFLLRNAPIAFSIDWAPGAGLAMNPDEVHFIFNPTFGGLGIKYVF